MIKVLKNGHKRRMVCIYCDCYYEYEEEDIQIIYFGRRSEYAYVKCPCCGKDNDLNA